MSSLGKINHFDQCLFFKINNIYSWFTSEANLLFDSVGFWLFDSPTLSYKKKNTLDTIEQFHMKAIPYAIRFKNETERFISN